MDNIKIKEKKKLWEEHKGEALSTAEMIPNLGLKDKENIPARNGESPNLGIDYIMSKDTGR